MNPALQRLYALWHQPAQGMDPAWWHALSFATWRDAYKQNPLVRPPLDALIAKRLGHAGPVPSLSTNAAELLADDLRREAICLALGLWALKCPDYLLLKPYREVLANQLAPRALGQLQALLPQEAHQTMLAPDELPAMACELGVAWLAHSTDPALRLCRLLWAPSPQPVPEQPIEPVLQKLLRWL